MLNRLAVHIKRRTLWQNAGHTLIEAIAAISVIAVCASFCLPSVITSMQKLPVSSSAQSIQTEDTLHQHLQRSAFGQNEIASLKNAEIEVKYESDTMVFYLYPNSQDHSKGYRFTEELLKKFLRQSEFNSSIPSGKAKPKNHS